MACKPLFQFIENQIDSNIKIYASASPSGATPGLRDAEYGMTVNVTTSSCYYRTGKETGWNWNLVPNDPYNRAWAGKCWVKMYVNFWGNPFHSTGASTEVFIYKNGKWKRNRTDNVYAGYSLGKL